MPLLLIDVDRTLSDNRERDRLSRREDGSLDWAKFTDPDLLRRDRLLLPSEKLWGLISALPTGEGILSLAYVTGREGTGPIQQATVQWLRHFEFPWCPLYFRPVGDRLLDHEVKADIIGALQTWFRAPYYALDDCGAAYQDPALLQDMYAREHVTVIDPTPYQLKMA